MSYDAHSASHIPSNHPQLPDQPQPSCHRHNRVVQNPSDGPGISRTTITWYGTPSKPLKEIPYRTTPALRQQKPRNPNTHPKPNGPWYGTERPKPRFQHSVPLPRGTASPKHVCKHSVPQPRGTASPKRIPQHSVPQLRGTKPSKTHQQDSVPCRNHEGRNPSDKTRIIPCRNHTARQSHRAVGPHQNGSICSCITMPVRRNL